jgi:hypothetical protein
LPVIDPQNRHAVISAGAAVLNARAALSRAHLIPVVERFPGGVESGLCARLGIRWPESVEELTPDHGLGILANSMVELRENPRGGDRAHPDRSLVARLAAMAVAEDSVLVQVARPDERLRVEELYRRARFMAQADEDYQAELKLWPERAEAPGSVVPLVLPSQRRSHPPGALLLLGTAVDDPMAWLRAGEALQWVRLELFRRGYATSSLVELVTVPEARNGLRRALGLHFYPHALLRVGHLQPAVHIHREDQLAGASSVGQ